MVGSSSILDSSFSSLSKKLSTTGLKPPTLIFALAYWSMMASIGSGEILYSAIIFCLSASKICQLWARSSFISLSS